MNDLLDLDLSAPPTQPSSSSTSSKLSPQAAYGTRKTAFDYLSQAGRALSNDASSSSVKSASPSPSPLYGSRSPSPLAVVPSSISRSNSPALAPSPQSANRPTTSADDAFSSLFGGSASASGPSARGAGASTTNMSLAEKLATSNAARFGSGGGTSPLNGSSAKAASSDPWDFDLLAKATPAPVSSKPSSSVAPPLDPFDLGFETTAAPPPSTRSPAPRNTGKIFDDDDDDDPFGTGISLSAQTDSTTTSTAPTTSESDDFDLLGAFSQPAAVWKPTPATSQQAPTPPSSSASRGPLRRSASPPPHILGQIVQMGFSVPQAQAALGATVGPTGEWRVEEALEVLIEQTSGGGAGRAQNEGSIRVNGPAPRRRPVALDDEERAIREAPVVGDSGWGSDDEEDARRRERRRREAEMDDDAPPPRPTALPTGRRAREAAARQRDQQQAADDSANDAVAAAQRQANELLSQASKIGFSMFKSANAYISAGKAQLQKALDEQRAGGEDGPGEGGASGGAGRRSRQAASTAPPGRAKWWTEEMEKELAEEEGPPSTGTTAKPSRSTEEPPPALFHDSEDDEVLPQRPQPPAAVSRAPVARAQAPSPAPSSAAPPVAQAMAAAAAYVSPWRRAKQQGPLAVDAAAMAQVPSPRARTPTPQPAAVPARPSYPPRTHVPVSPDDLATSTSHKTEGNDFFKLGRFGDASAEYTQAIDALPSGTLHLVPLLNNRATARLKFGEERLASEDCTLAIHILLAPYGGLPKQTGERVAWAALEAETLPSDVSELKLVDQLGKALGKRAKANEANEKWSAAAEDWSLALAAGGDVVKAAGGFKIVSDGVARCRKMVAGPTSAAALRSSTGSSNTRSAPPPSSRASNAPPARPFKPAVQGSGEAVKALKAANQASEAEDDLRLQLKDGVDAKILAWKGGKEQNLRALIASLDSVLWPDLGWKKVGMHELISEAQLKVRYVRAIAKLHPDKLNVQNTTVEQRMIAGLVFAALNDAWNAQKS
ncbi:BQ5605_C004g02757 [Microbotryum silenes-dioicae]|uniref:BQ5605_C004g02757 protein n=1 Tax=Microbotryum silenes-dioicae TaxID=796604 RepID=A0A2X0MCV1_9BASI|nr:BQ5605_C004g02757 [Microbotryum silenes-dioicae]